MEKVVTIFRELRAGATLDGKQKLKPPAACSPPPRPSPCWPTPWPWRAALAAGRHGGGFGRRPPGGGGKDEESDKISWKEYLENVMKKRGSGWLPLYQACRELNG